uniref:hypothetical protein Ycf38 n=1 Tax=Gloiopeltis furcata TaxID=42017 RepID=UPI0028D77811|nr:hypothetical protein Ycf38 [Gloiopeltis furcata]WMP13952.1 hypothetical protein Ycf38 [Gloiopeltis furcata]
MTSTLLKVQHKDVAVLTPQNKIRQANLISSVFVEISTLTKRLYIQASRRPSTLLAGVIQPLLWLVLFGALFQNAPVSLLTSETTYGKFLSPGIIIFTAFTGSINAGLPLMFDREFGFLNRILMSPMYLHDSILFSSIFFITTITIIQTVIVITCSSIMFANVTSIPQLAVILLIIFFITLSASSISICFAFILPGHIELLAFILIINLPMLFSSTALAPLSFMPTWLQIIASINPLTYAIESIRSVFIQEHIHLENIIMHSIWFDLRLVDTVYLLIFSNIISFLLVKKIISYKFE